MRFSTPTLAATVVGLVGAASLTPNSDTTNTTTLVLPVGTVTGFVDEGVEYYRGIPYAQPPIGALRLRPPVRLENLGSIEATGVGPACPQSTAIDVTPLALEALSLPEVQETLFFGTSLGDETEDCLTISVMRPQGTPANAKLPVLFYFFGGGFENGSGQAFNGSVLIPRSVSQDKPIILVTINYRLGAFGFLGGKEVLADGAANLGLLDQRLGLEWVSDNIAAFGGDPDAVTIWGQSAGGMSVFDQLALFDGNNQHKGRSLFRGAIMNSGSLLPTDPVDGDKAQGIFDKVVEAAGCSSATNGSSKLDCLREVDYATFLSASNSVPSYLSYNSLAFSYAPRPDGRILTASPEVLARAGKYAAVPTIIGNQENDGTMFAVFQPDVTDEDKLISYLNDVFFRNATQDEVAALVGTYPSDPDSPGGIGPSDSAYPEFKRLAAIIGDWDFHFMSRILLETFPESVPVWSYESKYYSGTPILGTYHATELPRVFYKTDDVSRAFQDLYISFTNSLDPNYHAANTTKCRYLRFWPTWQEKKELLEFGAKSTRVIKDDARMASFEYIRDHVEALRL